MVKHGGFKKLEALIEHLVQSKKGFPFVIVQSSPELRKKSLDFVEQKLREQYSKPNLKRQTVSDFLAEDRRYGRSRKRSVFVRRYFSLDAWLVSDIQNLGTREDDQEAFYLLLGACLERGCRIFVTSNMLPEDLGLREKYYIDVLTWGVVYCLKDDE